MGSAGARRARSSGVRSSPTTAIFAVALLGGLVLRIAMMFSRNELFDSDDAVVYLMSVHEMHGHLRAFFWGQPYGGTLEQATNAVFLRIVGLHPLVSPLVTTGWYLAATVLLRRLASRLYTPAVGDVAAAVFWLPGGRLMRVTFFDGGYYAPTLALGFAALLVATEPRGPSVRRVGGWGLLLGLGCWTSPNAMAFVFPAAVLGLWRWRAAERRARLLAVGLAGAFLGALPWLDWNARNRWLSLTSRHVAPHLVLGRVGTVLNTIIPAALGAGGDPALAHVVAVLVTVLLLGLVAHAIAARRLDRAAFAVSAPLGIALVASAAGGLPPAELRYAMFALPAGAVAVAVAAVGLTKLTSARSLLTAGALVAVTAVSSTTTLRLAVAANPTAPLAAASPGHASEHLSADTTELRHALAARGISAVYADYWAAFVVDMASKERLIAASTGPVRYPLYAAIAAAQPRTTIVVYAGGRDEAMLRAHVHAPADIFHVARWTVFAYDTRVSVRGLPFRGF